MRVSIEVRYNKLEILVYNAYWTKRQYCIIGYMSIKNGKLSQKVYVTNLLNSKQLHKNKGTPVHAGIETMPATMRSYQTATKVDS